MRRTGSHVLLALILAATGASCSEDPQGTEGCGLMDPAGGFRYCSAAGDQYCECVTNRCARQDTGCSSGWRYVFGSRECVPDVFSGVLRPSDSIEDLCPDGDAGTDADADGDDDGAADADADGDAPAETDAGCSSDDQCLAPGAAHCDTGSGACVPCDDPGQCAHLSGLPICHDGSCVGCLSHDDCDDDRLCNLTELRCVTACRGCSRDVDCGELGAGFFCVLVWPASGLFQCVQAGTVCQRPWEFQRTLGDGGSGILVDVCAPPPVTTCEGIMEFGDACTAATATQCGHDTIADDALCVGATSSCSIPCVRAALAHDEWCPVGTTCNRAANRCE